MGALAAPPFPLFPRVLVAVAREPAAETADPRIEPPALLFPTYDRGAPIVTGALTPLPIVSR